HRARQALHGLWHEPLGGSRCRLAGGALSLRVARDRRRRARDAGGARLAHRGGRQRRRPDEVRPLLDGGGGRVAGDPRDPAGSTVGVPEAWPGAVPVVGERVVAIPERSERGRNGLLFDFAEEAGLVRRLATCLGDRALADGLRAAGHADVEARYSLAAMARA